jgi:hypothetical protein
MNITPRYRIGDKVFYAGTKTIRTVLPCPDCQGSKKWKAESPAGEVFQFDCPRCCWQHEKYPAVKECVPDCRTLMIGSLRFDSDQEDGEWYEYMCEETGIGSGAVYRQSDLFPDLESAEKSAKLKCSLFMDQPKNRMHYNAARLAAQSTMQSLAIEEERKGRRKFQFQAEDAQRVVFDETLFRQ